MRENLPTTSPLTRKIIYNPSNFEINITQKKELDQLLNEIDSLRQDITKIKSGHSISR